MGSSRSSARAPAVSPVASGFLWERGSLPAVWQSSEFWLYAPWANGARSATEKLLDMHPADRLIDDLAAIAESIAIEAGEQALRVRRSSTRSELTTESKSSPTDLVTETDRCIEALIVERILAARPNDSIDGEEGAQVCGNSGIAWSIDPIDGTTNFVYDLPAWCTSIAASIDGQTCIAAVFAPVSGELYQAQLGRGAQLNDRPIRCSGQSDIAQALVATGFGYRAEIRSAQARIVSSVLPTIRDLRRLGAAALDLCQVAVGRVDAYYEQHLNPWDMAAGELIAREAGALTSDFDGGMPRPEEIIAATPGIHGPLRDLISSVVRGGSIHPADEVVPPVAADRAE